METKIKWESEMSHALARARKEGKYVLLDFFNPGWIGCQQMDAVIAIQTLYLPKTSLGQDLVGI